MVDNKEKKDSALENYNRLAANCIHIYCVTVFLICVLNKMNNKIMFTSH